MVGELLRLEPPASASLTGRPVASTNARTWAVVTGQRPISTASSSTTRSPSSPSR